MSKRHYLDFSLGPQSRLTDVIEGKMIFYSSSAQNQWLNITFKVKSKFLFRVYKGVLALSYLSYTILTISSYFPLLTSILYLFQTWLKCMHI